MLVPVLGVFVMLANMVLGLGAAASSFYQLLWRRGALSANAQGISA